MKINLTTEIIIVPRMLMVGLPRANMSPQALSASGSCIGLLSGLTPGIQKGEVQVQRIPKEPKMGSILEPSPAGIRGRKESRLDRLLIWMK